MGPGALRTPEIQRELSEAGCEVEVVLGSEATNFVGPAAFGDAARLSEEDNNPPEALVFAPATADTLARLARGLSMGPGEGAYAAGIRPAIVATELDEATSEHPAVRKNVELLRKDGCRMLEGTVSFHKEMASTTEIVNGVLNALGGPLSGLRVLVTAGGTHEPIDKVRFIGNRSSGKMGRAVAREALRLGAEVAVVAANVEANEPGTKWVDVETYAEVEEATTMLAAYADALVMAAAISDFTPAEVNEGKIRRGDKKKMDLTLVGTGDILKSVRESNPGLFMVGFAATFGDPVPDAREKLESKKVDLMVGNDISLGSGGFGSEENEVYIVDRDGVHFVPLAAKTEVARAILDALIRKIGKKDGRKED
ncbi:MAG: bifunctional phosphopantothenoylcysteine decarboxylase/phosphopantothenate--cysteine ligase CoaBC [Actinomycetota bacterium]|nr:bifunctional phosphopantothenoylcysteine decarboxylase/phosphopantothenate--cysteine ligase CoaBC [Actinomycetota bacterium]